MATSPTTTEGAIQFRYRLKHPTTDDSLDAALFDRMAAWRRVLTQLALIGRDPERYDGFAYGNLSVRDRRDPSRFFVTATQTGGAPRLLRSDVVRVDAWDVQRFEVDATGTVPPSSESITHGIIYAADAALAWIMHVHAPAIWRAAARLGLPVTAAEAGYGSPAMAHAVATLATLHTRRPLIFATVGHEDGVFACGSSADTTGTALIRVLSQSIVGMPR